MMRRDVLWRVMHESRHMFDIHNNKKRGRFGIPHIEGPVVPSYVLRPAKQVLPGGTALWNQAIMLNDINLA